MPGLSTPRCTITFLGVAPSEEHVQSRPLLPQARCELRPGHVGHDTIGDGKTDRLGLARLCRGFCPTRSLHNPITERAQHGRSKFRSRYSHRVPILHNQDGLIPRSCACLRIAPLRRFGDVPRRGIEARQIDLEQRSPSLRTVDKNPPSALADDPAYSGKPKPGVLARPPRREERFEHRPHRRRIHAGSRVSDGKLHTVGGRDISISTQKANRWAVSRGLHSAVRPAERHCRRCTPPDSAAPLR